jgi:hypothetical protein
MYQSIMPQFKLPPWFGGQMGVPGSDTPLGFRNNPQGVVYYVDGSHPDANDVNDGTDPNEPKATIQSAITASNATITWANTPPYVGMNWIIVSPGAYAENLTPPFYCKVIGLGLATGNTTDICVNVHPAAGSPLAGTGLASHWFNIRFECDTAVPVIDFDVMNSCVFENCAITDGNPGLATVGIDTTDANSSWIMGCLFKGNTNPLTIGIRSTGDFYSCRVIGNEICAVTTGIDLSGAALVGNAIAAHNYIWGGGAVLLGTGIDDSVVGDLLCAGNWITATDAISHADANMTIDNHVINAGVGAIELVGT